MGIIDDALKGVADILLPNERVSEDQATERMAICLSCEYMDKKKKKCTICKCFLEVKTTCSTNFNPIKARNEVTHCPQGYWGDKDTANIYRKKDGLNPLN